MATVVGPPPVHEPIATDEGMLRPAWNAWFWRLLKSLGGAQAGTWAGIDLTGSDLGDLVTKNHNDLETFQGGTTGEYYHLTQSQHDTLTDGSDASSLHRHDLSFTTVTNAESPYTVLATDEVLLINANAGAVTLNLPAVSTGKEYILKSLDSTNTITINDNATDLIDGAGSVTLAAQYDFIRIIGDGTTWHIIGTNF